MKRFESIFYLIVVAGLIIRYTGEGGSDSDRRGDSYIPGPPVSESGEDPLQRGGASLEWDIPGDVMVEIDSMPKSGTGTAFAVAPGRWITARHVVNRCIKVYLQFPGKQFYKVKGVDLNKSADMAVIRTPGFSRAAFSYSDKLPARGDMGFLMGYPQGKPGDIAAQMIGEKRMKSSGAYYAREKVIAWAERDRQPGFTGSAGGISGGPAFDSEGRVIGIAVAGAPRRGRIYTAHPDTLRARKLAKAEDGSGAAVRGGISSRRYHRIGNALRQSGRIAKAVCLV